MNIKSFIEGSILRSEALRKRRSVIIFTAFLLGLNMYGLFQSQRDFKKLSAVKDELMSIRAKAAVNHAQKTSLTRESHILRLLNQYNIDLQKSDEPPKKIE